MNFGRHVRATISGRREGKALDSGARTTRAVMLAPSTAVKSIPLSYRTRMQRCAPYTSYSLTNLR